MNNPYLPYKAEIIDITQETDTDQDIKTYRLKFVDGGFSEFMPGQFVELSIPGVGEAPFGFASSPLERDFIELSIKRTGLVTDAVHNLKKGSHVWIRGPFGNTFPLKDFEGSRILIIAGGLGLAPLRPLILYMLDPSIRSKYQRIDMLITARTPGDFVYKYDFPVWEKSPDIGIIRAIDRPVDGWDGKVGFPNMLIGDMDIDVKNTYALLCGPPIMIKAVVKSLVELGFTASKLYTTLEMRMTCGIGKCGKCNIGHRYVCIDGPVFSMEQLGTMPDEY